MTWSCLHPHPVLLTYPRERQVGWRSLGKHWPDTESDEDDIKADKDGDVEVLSRALQRMGALTHLALLNNAVHKEPYRNDGENDVASTLEVPSSEPLQSCTVMQHLRIVGSCNQRSTCSAMPGISAHMPFGPCTRR